MVAQATSVINATNCSLTNVQGQLGWLSWGSMRLDLGVVRSSPTLVVQPTLKKWFKWPILLYAFYYHLKN